MFPQQIVKVKKNICDYVDTWSSFWKEKNEEFNKFLVEDPHLYCLSGRMFHNWDGNHCLQAW